MVAAEGSYKTTGKRNKVAHVMAVISLTLAGQARQGTPRHAKALSRPSRSRLWPYLMLCACTSLRRGAAFYWVHVSKQVVA